MKMRLLYSLLGLVAILSLLACGPDKNSPEYVAEQYLLAIKRKDWEMAKNYTDENGRDMMDCVMRIGDDSFMVDINQIEDIHCDTDKGIGTCSFCCSDQNRLGELNMIKEEDRWKVAGKKEICPDQVEK